METTQTSINQRTNRKIVVYPDNGLLLINKKKLQIHKNMNGSQKNYAKWKKKKGRHKGLIHTV